jgi:hypothetical protein
MQSTTTPHSDECENCSTTDVVDESVSEQPEKTTPSVRPSLAPLITNERQEATEASQASSNQLGVHFFETAQISSTLEPITIPTAYLTPEEHVAWLWNSAYDQLMMENPEMIYEYEMVVSNCIKTGNRPEIILRRSSELELGVTAQVEHQARKKLMDNCLDDLLREAVPSNDDASTTSGDTIKSGPDGDTNEAGEVAEAFESDARSLKNNLREIVQESQHASLAWVATWLIMDVRYIVLVPLFPFLDLQILKCLANQLSYCRDGFIPVSNLMPLSWEPYPS